MGNYWTIWLNYNVSMTAGTYIELYSDGLAYRVTVEPDGCVRDYIKID